MGRGFRWRRGGGGGGFRGRGRGWKQPRAVASHEVEEEEQDDDDCLDDASAPTAPITAEQLTAEQRTAAERALRGESIFLTGAAGTGKSFLLRYLVQEFQEQYDEQSGAVAVTAPTGIAASNVGGQTIHSFAGVGLGEGSVRKLVALVKKSAAATQRWQFLRILIIDEVSMLDADLFEALCSIGASVRSSRTPFGGIQVITCGDFLQLPPVQGRGQQRKRFAFQTKAWMRCGLDRGTIILQESVRQSGDPLFIRILNEVRVGIVSSATQEALSSCNIDVKQEPEDGIIPTKLYCLNKNVDRENTARLDRLPGTAVTMRAADHFKGVRDPQRRNMLLGQLDKRIPGELRLKLGAQVILVKNQPALGLVNGSRGVIQEFRQGRPVVRFDNGQTVHVGKERFTVGSSSASLLRIQVPLKLGWALTVHKAQGMTLSRAELQVDDSFEVGQAYVALSRLTSLSGLWISGGGLTQSTELAHPEVLEYYRTATSSPGMPRNDEHPKTHVGTTSACLGTIFPQTKAMPPLPSSSTCSKNVRVHSQTDCSLGLNVCSGPSSDPAPKRQRTSNFDFPELDADSNTGFGWGSPPLSRVVQCATPQSANFCLKSGLSEALQSSADACVGWVEPPKKSGLSEALQSSADACVGWVEPPKTWGGGVIELD